MRLLFAPLVVEYIVCVGVNGIFINEQDECIAHWCQNVQRQFCSTVRRNGALNPHYENWRDLNY